MPSDKNLKPESCLVNRVFAAVKTCRVALGFYCQYETAEINKPLPMASVSCLRQL